MLLVVVRGRLMRGVRPLRFMKRLNLYGSTCLLPFFVLAYALSWAMWVPAALASQNLSPWPLPLTPLLIAGSFGPSAAAFIFTARHEGAAGAWRLFKRGFAYRLPFSLLVFIVVVPVAITFIAFVISSDADPVLRPFTLLATFVLLFFLGGSFGEEFGWRGYALPRLLERTGALGSSLALGAVWAAWHLPLFWVRETSQFSTPFWLFFVFMLAFSVMFTWVHQKSGGNLFAALLLHTVFNLTVVLFPPPEPVGGVDQSMYYTTGLFVLVAAFLIMRGKSSKGEEVASAEGLRQRYE